MVSEGKKTLSVRDFGPLAALMIGYAFLMLAGGMNSLIIPIRGSAEGFSTVSLGLLGTFWAVGFISGSLYVPHLVARVGHVRIFAVMASLATLAVLASAVIVNPIVWIPLRAAAGFCFAGAAMIVEAWLNESTNRSTRGRVFGIYTMVNLGATTAGQMLLVTGDTNGVLFFIVAAMFYTLGMVPPALSAQTKPKPLRTVSFDLTEVWRNSPIAAVVVVLIGVSNGAFGSLGAVFGQKINLDITTIATFMSATILAGALIQIPVGYLSDRFDRRVILVGLILCAIIVDAFFLLTPTYNVFVVIGAGALLGGAMYSLPPVIMAYANDHAPKDRYVQTSSSLLMMFGGGAIAGPIIAGITMDITGEKGLFWLLICAHLIMVIYTLYRSLFYKQKKIAPEDKSRFTRIEPGRVILQPPQLSEMDFGLDEDDRIIPVVSDRIREAFSTKQPLGDKNGPNLQSGRSSDDDHGGW